MSFFMVAVGGDDDENLYLNEFEFIAILSIQENWNKIQFFS